MRNLLRHILLLPRKAIIGMIWCYQHTLSPDHGPLKGLWPYGYCRHEPTCSVYAQQVFRDRGVVVGGWLALRRLIRCNPWTPLSEEKLRSLTSSQLR